MKTPERHYWPLYFGVSIVNFEQIMPTAKLFNMVKVSKYGAFSSPYFPVFGLNTVIYGVNFPIQSEYGKIRTRKTPYLDTFHAVIYTFFTTIAHGFLTLMTWLSKRIQFMFF